MTLKEDHIEYKSFWGWTKEINEWEKITWQEIGMISEVEWRKRPEDIDDCFYNIMQL